MSDAAIALLDLDGTVADYDTALREGLARIAAPSEPKALHYPLPGRPVPDWMDARKDLVSRQPGFYRSLRKLPIGISIYWALLELGFEIHVLTKGPVRNTTAWTQKVEWCQEHLPEARVTITQDKSLMYGKVLVDDWPPFFTPWLQARPRGLLVVPKQPWNEVLALPGNAVLADKPVVAGVVAGDRLYACLKAARDRRPGDSLVMP